MADIGESIRAYVAENAGVAALVGPRVYHDGPPQGVDARTSPLIVVGKTSGTCDQNLAGTIGGKADRLQFDCRAGSRVLANQIAEAVLSALKTLTASLAAAGGTVTVGTCAVSEVDLKSGDRWEAFPPPDGSDEWIRTAAVDARFFYS